MVGSGTAGAGVSWEKLQRSVPHPVTLRTSFTGPTCVGEPAPASAANKYTVRNRGDII
ncbi:MAG: hypothetical protein LUD02_10525 [Tannerellaceae bacterium]|nr:hypothetical protein [Tannerellaceae bacterium]MCD8264505.1 hypothetical protein [Tannerellaceae bacterium]